MIVPVDPAVNHQSMRITLDGSDYVLEFRWNGRESAWYMHVKLPDQTDVIDSVKVVVGWPLSTFAPGSSGPPGFFFAEDTSGLGIDPGLNDLGDRVVLHYVGVNEASV